MKFAIAGDAASGLPPFFATEPPPVTTRGGYLFVPSMSALRMIGMGVIDPHLSGKQILHHSIPNPLFLRRD